MFVLTILEKNQETRLIFLQGGKNMANYEETGITRKKFQDEELPHELFLTTRQKN